MKPIEPQELEELEDQFEHFSFKEDVVELKKPKARTTRQHDFGQYRPEINA